MKPLTLYKSENLSLMKSWPDESVDLVYLDPPFNTGRDFGAFDDRWSNLNDYSEKHTAVLTDALQRYFDAVYHMHSTAMISYLKFMAHRLAESKRLLKDTGSIYLHCDDTSVHYLKPVMDSVFGVDNYLNTIVWRRAPSHNDPNRYGRILDHILYYSKERTQRTWNGEDIVIPRTDEELAKNYSLKDYRGRYRADSLNGPSHGGKQGSPGTLPWRGVDVHAVNRHWAVPKTGKYAKYIEHNFIPGFTEIDDLHERLDKLADADLLHYTKGGKFPYLKRYRQADNGKPPQNLILEVSGFTNFNSQHGEYAGYPTQKPLALTEKFIKASSNEGDVVLDPFCGSGSTLVAAESLRRNWVGIDISAEALKLAQSRIGQLGVATQIVREK